MKRGLNMNSSSRLERWDSRVEWALADPGPNLRNPRAVPSHRRLLVVPNTPNLRVHP
jgi:hypothetical protein